MDTIIIGFIAIASIGVLLFILSMFINRKKKKVVYKTSGIMRPEVKIEMPGIITNDHKKFEKFVSEYDDGSLKFDNVNYRSGARNTCSFGLSEGYRKINGQFNWDYVRIHSGVDRARGGEKKGINDVVQSPFNFHRSSIIDYGDKIYGTLISLWQDEYEFEFRIAHMNPKTNIIPWSLEQFRYNRPFQRDWYIGSAGNYGDSDGAHTHTEVKSYDERSEVLELILEEKFGDKAFKEYSPASILSYYRKRPGFAKASDREILDDWMQQKKIRKAFFVNNYMYRYTDFDGKPKTRYSSALLFNGL